MAILSSHLETSLVYSAKEKCFQMRQKGGILVYVIKFPAEDPRAWKYGVNNHKLSQTTSFVQILHDTPQSLPLTEYSNRIFFKTS